MSYFLSKAVWLAAQPLSLAFLAIAIALLCGLLRWRKGQTAFGLIATLILFLSLYTSLGTVALQTLEDRIARAELPSGGPACLIVLGGSFEAEVIASRGGLETNQAGDRFVEALRLAQRYPQARILVSGGDGRLFLGDGIQNKILGRRRRRQGNAENGEKCAKPGAQGHRGAFQ